MARIRSGGDHHKAKKPASSSGSHRKSHKVPGVEKSRNKKSTAPIKSRTSEVSNKLAVDGTGKRKPVVATRNSRSRKRKSRDDRVEDGREEKDNNDDDAEIADVPPQSKMVKTNTTPRVPGQSKPTEIPTRTDGMSSKDAARLRQNVEIMEISDGIEYEALFMKMIETKELIGKLGNAQAERNKRLGELANNARAKANARKLAWVKNI